MRAAGAEIFDLQRDHRGALEFVYAAPNAPDPAAAVEEARQCEDGIRRPVQTAWGLQRAPKGEERERIRAWLASTGGTPPAISAAGLDECLRDGGAIAENETIDDLAERMQDEGRMLYPPAVNACLDDVTGKAYRSD